MNLFWFFIAALVAILIAKGIVYNFPDTARIL